MIAVVKECWTGCKYCKIAGAYDHHNYCNHNHQSLFLSSPWPFFYHHHHHHHHNLHHHYYCCYFCCNYYHLHLLHAALGVTSDSNTIDTYGHSTDSLCVLHLSSFHAGLADGLRCTKSEAGFADCSSAMGVHRNGSSWNPVIGVYGEVDCIVCTCLVSGLPVPPVFCSLLLFLPPPPPHLLLLFPHHRNGSSWSSVIGLYGEVDCIVCTCHLLVGLEVKASASRAEDPGFESRFRREFFGVDSYQ